jgi:predicted O-methyltransferase YrrM
MKDNLDFRNYLNELVEIDKLLKYALVPDEQRPHCIGDASGKFLFLQVLAVRPKIVLEIGTSYGYSTVWLCSAAELIGSRVVSIEKDGEKLSKAKNLLGKFNLTAHVELIQGNALDILDKLNFEPEFVLIDAEKSEYVHYVKKLLPKSRRQIFVYADNVLSHRNQLGSFITFLENSDRIWHELVPIGKGIEMCLIKGEYNET